MNLPGIGPGGGAADGVELSEEVAHNLVSVGCNAQSIQLRHHSTERPLHLADRSLGIKLPLLLEAALAFDDFFSVEIRKSVEHRIAVRMRIGQEA